MFRVCPTFISLLGDSVALPNVDLFNVANFYARFLARGSSRRLVNVGHDASAHPRRRDTEDGFTYQHEFRAEVVTYRRLFISEGLCVGLFLFQDFGQSMQRWPSVPSAVCYVRLESVVAEGFHFGLRIFFERKD